MHITEIKYTEKMKAVLDDPSPFIFMLGATGCSKSITSAIKFGKRVMNAPPAQANFTIICTSKMKAKDVIFKDSNGFYNLFKELCPEIDTTREARYLPDSFSFAGKYGPKTIYLAGADDKTAYTQILGMNIGGIWLEEGSVLNIDAMRESFLRIQRQGGGWIILTSNGGLPTQEFYTEFVNHAIMQFPDSVPKAEKDDMVQDDARYHYYHFNLEDDTPHLNDEQRQGIYKTIPVGSFYYFSKVLGVRGFQDGVLYATLIKPEHLIPADKINTDAFCEIICSVDMGTSVGVEDTKHAHTIATIVGYTQGYKRVVVLESHVIPSNDFDAVIREVDLKLMPFWANYYTKLTKIVVDYGDSGGLLVRTWREKTRLKNVTVKACIKTGKIGLCKDINLQSRAQLKCQLLMGDYLLWTTKAEESFKAHKRILATKDGEEMEQSDINNDYADSLTYALTEKWLQVSRITKF